MKLQGLVATAQSLSGGLRPTFGFIILPFVRVALLCHFLELCGFLVPPFVGVVLLPGPTI